MLIFVFLKLKIFLNKCFLLRVLLWLWINSFKRENFCWVRVMGIFVFWIMCVEVLKVIFFSIIFFVLFFCLW